MTDEVVTDAGLGDSLAGEPLSSGATRTNRMARRAAWAIIALVAAFASWIVVASIVQPRGDPGLLTEQQFAWPDEEPLPRFTDVTDDWGLGEWRNTSESQLSGGVGAADLDSDGLLDLVVAGGDVAVFFNDGGTFTRASGDIAGLPDGAVSVGLADLDSDSYIDLMIGTTASDAIIVWGGAWAESRDLSVASVTRLAGGTPTTGPIELPTGTELLDVVRLGYGQSRSVPDVVFRQVSPRKFEAEPLPHAGRRSMAAEVVDIDYNGRPDIWITRDVGWRGGPDSIFSLDDDGRWSDIAGDLGADLAIDGMGVTIGDLDGDSFLDAYLSDLGDNEALLGSADGFVAAQGTGAAHIRPTGTGGDLVSSSWASGVGDFNLDGKLDLLVVNGGFPFSPVENKIRGTRVVLNDPPAVLLGLGDGRFAEVWPELGLSWTGAGRGLAIGDFDADGDSDIVMSRLADTLVVLRNDAAAPSVRTLAQVGCVATAAVVRVQTEMTDATSLLRAHSFLGVHATEFIAGTHGRETRLRVDWANGARSEQVIAPAEGRQVYVTDCNANGGR